MGSVDVVIPCYRYGRYLRECVASVLSQDAQIRILLIDDASPDETPEVAAELERSDSRITYRRHSTNLGHIASYNEGIEWVAADYYVLISADDYLLPGALKRAVDLMETHREIGFVFGNAIAAYDDGRTVPIRVDIGADHEGVVAGAAFLDACRRQSARNIVPPPTVVIRSELQKRIGGYDPRLPHAADFELWLRLAAHGQVGFLRAEQAVYRRHSTNMSLEYTAENILRDLRERKLALDLFFASHGKRFARHEVLRAGFLRALAIDAMAYSSAALNRKNWDAARQIREFALAVSPQSYFSAANLRLTAKRMLTSLAPRRAGRARETR